MRFFSLLFLFISLHTVYSQNQLLSNDIPYKTALDNSKTQGKPVFVMLYADWCPHCNMRNEFF
ncbi:hypothetical protein ACFFWB_23765 [Flavobacterium procerum]|uniref:hypothetical protein n=1 Tax=Flavobacterium procerum TaxID=1455569 RepID=UPI0035E52C52